MTLFLSTLAVLHKVDAARFMIEPAYSYYCDVTRVITPTQCSAFVWWLWQWQQITHKHFVTTAVWTDWVIFKAIGNKFSFKCSPNTGWYFGLFWKHTAVATFWTKFGELWLLFCLTSGHTEPQLNKCTMWVMCVLWLLKLNGFGSECGSVEWPVCFRYAWKFLPFHSLHELALLAYYISIWINKKWQGRK